MFRVRVSSTLLALCFAVFSSSAALQAQDKPSGIPLSEISKHSHYFELKDGKFVGEGADFLEKEFSSNQYVLLGEYHNSKRISLFTKAIIPSLHRNGFRYFTIEVGPVSKDVLNELSNDPYSTTEELRKLNDKFVTPTFRRLRQPIPFFSNVSDAGFLAEIRKQGWSLIGIDQEFSFGYGMLIARTFENLDSKRKTELKSKFQNALEANASIIRKGLSDRSRYLLFRDSKIIHEYLDEALEGNPRNERIVKLLRKTNDIYAKGAKRRYYAQNSERIAHMRSNLSSQMRELNFDLKKDKMLVKLGGVHTSKGFGPLSLYEVGNTLYELADFHGNTSIHINFRSRFSKRNGKLVDNLSDSKAFPYRFKSILQVAKPDKWTVIDLRPMRDDVFYQRKYKLDIVISELFKMHDVIIIPEAEIPSEPNYTPRKSG